MVFALPNIGNIKVKIKMIENFFVFCHKLSTPQI